jgi:hypothetical protein
MTNMTPRESVEFRLRLLDPPETWEPAPAIALARFRARVEEAEATRARRSSRAWAWLGAVSAVCIVLLLVPTTRAGAQRLWDVFFSQRLEMVRIEIDRLPRSFTDQRIEMVGANMQVATLEEAAQHVRFVPRLPDPAWDASIAASVAGPRRLLVAGSISVESRVDVDDLESAARRAGLSDVHFPPAWDGARIGVHSSPIAVAEYPRFQLAQVLPLAITTPPGFELGAFTERVLRIGGLTPSAAREYAAQMAAAPFAMFAVSPKDALTMQRVTVGTAQGTLVHNVNADGTPGDVVLVWTTTDRLYMLTGRLADAELLAIADAIR